MLTKIFLLPFLVLYLSLPTDRPMDVLLVCYRATINPRRECWFIVDTKWLQGWAKFVRGEGPPPGRISNEGEARDTTSRNSCFGRA